MGTGQRMIVDSLLGQTLGNYVILESLGRGGMAQVYRAYHPQLDRQAAIKVLRADLVDDESFLSRFRGEAQAIAALRHPHIVQVYDLNVQDGLPYMVMELLEGDTLKTRLCEHRVRGEPVPLGDVVRILLDVLDGLAYAHGEGVVHRDIKPANILLTRYGEAVLADFGIAQIVGSTRHTASGALMGTLSYIAPEQGLEGHSDARSDLYSLGIVFYEMLTQRTPFDANTPLAILMSHLNDPIDAPRDFDSDIPESIECVVLKALAKQPEARYQAAADMAAALEQAVEDAGIDLPARVSLPISSPATVAQAETAAVLSGESRSWVTHAESSRAETAAGLARRLIPSRARQLVSARPNAHKDHSLGGAIVRAVGLLLLGNMAAVTVAAVSDRWTIFVTGWPVELLLAGVGLCIVMSAASCIWLLIPIGILLGNGVLLSYTTLTGRWAQWRVLWPFELWFVLGIVVLTLWLARRGEQARVLSRWLGRALGWLAAAWSLLVVLAAAVA
jgi:serine/threonine protein kinase